MNYTEQKEARFGYQVQGKRYKRKSYKYIKRGFNRTIRRINKERLKKGEEEFISPKYRSGYEF